MREHLRSALGDSCIYIVSAVAVVQASESSGAVAAYPDYADCQRKTDRQIPVFVLEPVTG
jgi:hypothetical protein